MMIENAVTFLRYAFMAQTIYNNAPMIYTICSNGIWLTKNVIIFAGMLKYTKLV